MMPENNAVCLMPIIIIKFMAADYEKDKCNL